MKFNAWFQCINGCPGIHPLNEIIYRCPECNELLEVQHDINLLKQLSPDEWKKLFRDRVGALPQAQSRGQPGAAFHAHAQR